MTRRLPVPALLALSLLGAWPASGYVPSPYGVNVHAPQGQTLVRHFQQVETAGIGWVRVDFAWYAIETGQNAYSWGVYDAIVGEAERRGIEVLGVLAYTPAWATDGAAQTGVPRSVSDWEDFCFRAAERYRGRVAAWELWNEPNLPRFWTGTRDQYIERIVLPGAAALRAGDPTALVGGPGLAHLTSGQSDWYDWLLETLQRAGDRLDFVSHHVYDEDGPGDVTTRLEANTPFGGQPQFWDIAPPSVREVLTEAGAAAEPFWLTETGWDSNEVGEGPQASFTSGLLDRWLTGDPARTWLHKIFFYELADAPSGAVPHWGLLRGDETPKPAMAAYREFISDHPVAPPEPPQLVLAGGRFGVGVRWRDHRNGGTGVATPVSFSNATGVFWFFTPANIELVVKILDGRPVNGRHWVFFGALSDVEYWVTVTDRATGAVREYRNPPNTLCGQTDTGAFAGAELAGAELAGAALAGASLDEALVVVGPWEAPEQPVLVGPVRESSGLFGAPAAMPPLFGAATAVVCSPSDSTLCLRNGRFAVEVAWHDQHNQRTGIGHALPSTAESGYFWFFNGGNLELVVKILDGRGVNGRFWTFYGALSDVEYTITITDTATGARRTYRNAPGSFCGRADVEAF